MPSDLLGGWHEVCQLANNDLAACQSVLPMSRGPSCEVVFRKGRLWRRCAASGKPSDPILPYSRTSRRVGLDPTDGGSAESLVGSEDPGAVQHMVPAGESTPGLACATITRLRTPRASAKNFCAGEVNFRRAHPDILATLLWTISTFPPPRTAGWNTSRLPRSSHGASSGLGHDPRMACSRQECGVHVSSDSSEPPTGSPHRL